MLTLELLGDEPSDIVNGVGKKRFFQAYPSYIAYVCSSVGVNPDDDASTPAVETIVVLCLPL